MIYQFSMGNVIMKEEMMSERIIKEDKCSQRYYVCSRVKHAPYWIALREKGISIVSSWIDEAGDNETEDFGELWKRIESEIYSDCNALLMMVYPEDFPLKGALVEVGIALAYNKKIYIYAPNVILEGRTFRPLGSWIKHPNVTFIDNIENFLQLEQQ